MENIREKINTSILEIAEVRGAIISDDLTDETILLNTGLDSLGFAILVAKLDEELGYDPFVLMDDPVYPQTFGEFVEIYSRFSNK